MKKSFLLFTLLMLSDVWGQNAYYDAIKLRTYIGTNGKFIASDETKLKEIGDILYLYVKTPSVSTPNFAYIKSQFERGGDSHNPFISPLMPTTGSGNNPLSGGVSFFEKIGSIPVTNFADGLAKFLVERGKEELNVAFFRKFQEFMKNYPEANIVFPTTHDFILKINSFQYSAMLPALKTAFQKDLNTLTDNLLLLRNLNPSSDCPATDASCQKRVTALITFLSTDEGRAILGSIIIANNIIKGNNAADTIDNLANDDIIINYPDENLSNIVLFINLISKSLRSADEGRVWVSKQQINDLVKDEIAFKIYLGLLYAIDQKNTQNNHHIQVVVPNGANLLTISLKEILEKLNATWATNSTIFISSFKKMAYQAATISDTTENLLAKTVQKESSIILYTDYAASFSQFLKTSVTFIESTTNIFPQLANLTNSTKKFITVIDYAVNASHDIKSQNYSALIVDTSLILDQLYPSGYEYRESYMKYGTFMANIIEADNSEEVKAAIEAAVLPVGSSSIKRETDFNIAINAYIGGYGGAEIMQSKATQKTAFSAGVTAPVGIAFSWGKLRTCQLEKKANNPGGKSFTIFMPLIDVGTLASYRINDSETEIASTIELRNIVSPGLYFYWGFGKCPISIGAGAQIGTELRKVTAEAVQTDTKNIYIRYGITLVVDIPLFNLFTKSK